MLCKSSKKDDIQYGEFLKNKKFGVHTFCLVSKYNNNKPTNKDLLFKQRITITTLISFV